MTDLDTKVSFLNQKIQNQSEELQLSYTSHQQLKQELDKEKDEKGKLAQQV